jgi:hypothetical protein
LRANPGGRRGTSAKMAPRAQSGASMPRGKLRDRARNFGTALETSGPR